MFRHMKRKILLIAGIVVAIVVGLYTGLFGMTYLICLDQYLQLFKSAPCGALSCIRFKMRGKYMVLYRRRDM